MTEMHPERDALMGMGLTPEQIDEALARITGGAHKYPGDPVQTTLADPYRVEQLERENGIAPLAPRCEQTAADLFMSLNGFDEIGIAQAFGAPVGELRRDPVTLGRALIFVHARRSGMKHDDAYQYAMEQTIQTVSHDYFPPEPKADPAPASAEGNAPSA